MSGHYLYDPSYCDNGNICTGDCDNCPVADEMFEDEEERHGQWLPRTELWSKNGR